MRYRVEWRPLPVEAPSLAQCRRVADVDAVRDTVRALSSDVASGEFAVALLDRDGRAASRVIADASAILAASWTDGDLPRAIAGDWSRHEAGANAAAGALEGLVGMLAAAAASGAVSTRAAASLAREARRLLDDDDEDADDV